MLMEFMKEIFMTPLYLYQYQLKSKNIVDIDTNNYKGKYKQYFLADSGYDTNEIKLELDNLGLIPLIPQNKKIYKKRTSFIR